MLDFPDDLPAEFRASLPQHEGLFEPELWFQMPVVTLTGSEPAWCLGSEHGLFAIRDTRVSEKLAAVHAGKKPPKQYMVCLPTLGASIASFEVFDTALLFVDT